MLNTAPLPAIAASRVVPVGADQLQWLRVVAHN